MLSSSRGGSGTEREPRVPKTHGDNPENQWSYRGREKGVLDIVGRVTESIPKVLVTYRTQNAELLERDSERCGMDPYHSNSTRFTNHGFATQYLAPLQPDTLKGKKSPKMQVLSARTLLTWP